MFTGIIQDIGLITKIQKKEDFIHIKINSSLLTNKCKRGDSIAVNGICLTITKKDGNTFAAEAVKQTVKTTTISYWSTNDKVNLETAVTPNTFLGGHIVQGHSDGVAEISAIKFFPNNTEYDLLLPKDLVKYCVIQGSIAINGVSLTIAKIESNKITVSIIPTTFKDTTIHLLKKTDQVNIEVDVFGKYIYNYLKQIHEPQKNIITKEFLIQHGF